MMWTVLAIAGFLGRLFEQGRMRTLEFSAVWNMRDEMKKQGNVVLVSDMKFSRKQNQNKWMNNQSVVLMTTRMMEYVVPWNGWGPSIPSQVCPVRVTQKALLSSRSQPAGFFR